MARRTWEEEYERSQSRLRDAGPRCEHRGQDGTRCPAHGQYVYDGYRPALERGVLCSAHRAEQK